MPCNDIIPDHAIENIYDVEPITVCRCNCGCINNDTKNANVDIFNNGDEMLLLPIKRTYYREKELWSREGEGKVVKHEYFILKPEYRRKGTAKKIHERELEAYRTYNFIEIQLDAAWDGIVVWSHLFFKPKDDFEAKKAVPLIQRYLSEVKGYDLKKIKEVLSAGLEKISKSHLTDPSIDFSEWANRLGRQRGKQVLVKMYKEVS